MAHIIIEKLLKLLGKFSVAVCIQEGEGLIMQSLYYSGETKHIMIKYVTKKREHNFAFGAKEGDAVHQMS